MRDALPGHSPRLGNAERWFAVGLAGAAATVLVLFGLVTRADYRETLENGWARTTSAAELLADHTEATIEASRLIVDRIADLVGDVGLDHVRGAGWEKLRDIARSAPQVGTIHVIDANGDLVASSEARESPRVSVADRPYFNALKDGDRTVLGGLTVGRLSGSMIFTYSQAIRSGGTFRGVVNIAIPIEHFRTFYDGLKIDLGPDAVLDVHKRDGGVVLMRWPLSVTDVTHHDSHDLPSLHDDAPGRAGRIDALAPDGTPLLKAFRISSGHDLVAGVMIPRPQVLRPFWDRLAFNAVLLSVALCVMTAFTLLAIRAARHERSEASERRTAERILAERTRQLEGICEHAPMGLALFTATPPYRVIACNGAYQQFWSELFPSELPADGGPLPLAEKNRLAASLDEVARTGVATTVYDFCCEDAAGGRSWWHCHLSPVVVDGKVTALVHTLVDVTREFVLRRELEDENAARAIAEANLRASEEHFRAVFDNAFAGIANASTDGRLLWANDRFCELVGYTEAELRGMLLADITHADDLKSTLNNIRLIVSDRIDSCQMRKRYLRKDGSIVWVELSAAGIRAADGTVSSVVAVATDITERRAAEAALRRSEERLRIAGEAGQVGVWDWDVATGILTWTAPQWRLHGIPPQDGFTYEDWRRLVHPSDLARIEAAVMEAVATCGVLEDEYRIVLPDGSIRWVAVRCRVGHNEAGQPLRLTGVNFDITARKNLEEQQRLLARELDHRVRNTLANVQAIVSVTARRATDPDAFRDSVTRRVISLARTHTLLTDGHGAIPLKTLFRLELDPYDDDHSGRIAVDGPDIVLPSVTALSLGMAVHELTTNAVKYGALSVAAGRLTVRWSVEADPAGPKVLSIVWTEHDGPAAANPGQPGFGTRLIDGVVAEHPGSHVSRDFAPEGLRVEIRMPLPMTDKPRLKLVS